ncbi:MAG TPA: hypothetical protein VFA74_10035 [Terriglobales bacterium]|nr:hypothetical protein [Terriglobales bacterium]
MLTPKSLAMKTKFAQAAIFVACLALLACSVNVKKNGEGDDKNVDIKTPVGDLHVGKDVDVHDTGLPVYPGAQKKEKKDNGDETGANVNIATSFFGVKVVALEYTSADAASKVAEFYKDQLRKKFGDVLECHTTKRGDDFNFNVGKDDKDENKDDKQSDKLKCEGNGGNSIELKVGTKDNQHIVTIEPKDKGTDFALVYVQARGKQGSI